MPDVTNLELVTRDDACRILSLSLRQVDRLIASGELESIKIGRALRIPVPGIREFIDRRRAAA